MIKLITYDVECLSELFLCCIKNYHTKEETTFEISKRKNDILDLVNFFNNKELTTIGFNSLHYDNLLINKFIIDYKKISLLEPLDICKELRQVSDWIIEDGRLSESVNYQKYSKYKYNQPFQSIDLFLYWSKMLRLSKKLSLKSLAVWLNHPLIQEFNGSLDNIDEYISYCQNDVAITESLLLQLLPDVKLRYNIKKEYGIDCLSWDSVKIASNLLADLYEKKTGIKPEQKDNIYYYIDISKILLDYEFKTNKYIDLHNYIKNKIVKSTSEIKYRLITQNPNDTILATEFASGGIHGIVDENKIIIQDDEELWDIDIESMYPSLIIEHNFYPKHLGIEFLQLYSDIKTQRIKAKKEGNKVINETFKLILNGAYGLMNNQYSWLRDLKEVLSITLNGQLIIAYLTELFQLNGMSVVMQNTDGETVIVKKHEKELFKSLIKEVEDKYKMKFEFVQYKQFINANVNNYLAETIDGKIKTKGMFVTDPVIGNSNDFLVIPKALKAFYIDGIKPEEFIIKHGNIYDFCSAKKIDRQYTVYYRGDKQQQLNRFYVSKRGAYLYKQKTGKQTLENVLKDCPITLFNKFESKPMDKYEIDYQYYINKVREIIIELNNNNQLKMF